MLNPKFLPNGLFSREKIPYEFFSHGRILRTDSSQIGVEKISKPLLSTTCCFERNFLQSHTRNTSLLFRFLYACRKSGRIMGAPLAGVGGGGMAGVLWARLATGSDVHSLIRLVLLASTPSLVTCFVV